MPTHMSLHANLQVRMCVCGSSLAVRLLQLQLQRALVVANIRLPATI